MFIVYIKFNWVSCISFVKRNFIFTFLAFWTLLNLPKHRDWTSFTMIRYYKQIYFDFSLLSPGHWVDKGIFLMYCRKTSFSERALSFGGISLWSLLLFFPTQTKFDLWKYMFILSLLWALDILAHICVIEKSSQFKSSLTTFYDNINIFLILKIISILNLNLFLGNHVCCVLKLIIICGYSRIGLLKKIKK